MFGLFKKKSGFNKVSVTFVGVHKTGIPITYSYEEKTTSSVSELKGSYDVLVHAITKTFGNDNCEGYIQIGDHFIRLSQFDAITLNYKINGVTV